MSRILVDTNVLIYAIDKDSKYFKTSSELLSSNNEIFVSSKSLCEFYAVTTRAPSMAITEEQSLGIVMWFYENFPVLFPDNKSTDTLLHLLKRFQPKGLKVHDFEILSIGIANRMNQMATFNSKDFPEHEDIELLDLKKL